MMKDKSTANAHQALAIQIHLPPPVVQSRWYSEPVRILTFDVDAFRNNAKGYPALPQDHQNYFHKLMKLKSQPWLLMCDATPLKTTVDPGKANDSNFPALRDATNLPTTEDDHYVQYLRHLQTKQSTQTPMDQFGAGYQDYLQAPLQPLTVNLESVTYEVFEKDPIKYEWYERAVARALHDWLEQGKPTSNPDGRVVVAVVGAGRGPLVSRALKAAEDVGVEIDMWALEKNPNAYVLLQRHNQNKWDNKVTLVKSDMRTWQGPQTNKMLSKVQKTFNVDAEDQSASTAPPTIPLDATLDPHTSASHVSRYKIDILISELLGSFADNELSPECLDGVQHLMNPIHGISVPRSYTAHFTPVAAPKLHADISLSMTHVNPHAAEIPYVVMFDQVDFLSTTTARKEDTSTTSSPTKPKTFASLLSKPRVSNASTNSTRTTIPPPTPVISTAWEFVHPNPSVSLPPVTNSHNARYGRFTFPTPHQGTCHGLAGYFETVLYPGVELSTNPLTMEDKSSGMISWFPIFFPFKKPIFLPDNGEVDVSMWRMTDDRKVWYEWVMEVYMIIDANEGKAKRRHKVGATDLHSSEKEACLM